MAMHREMPSFREQALRQRRWRYRHHPWTTSSCVLLASVTETRRGGSPGCGLSAASQPVGGLSRQARRWKHHSEDWNNLDLRAPDADQERPRIVHTVHSHPCAQSHTAHSHTAKSINAL